MMLFYSSLAITLMMWLHVCYCYLNDVDQELIHLVAPHSAFMDPSVPKDTPNRVSLEIRAIVIG